MATQPYHSALDVLPDAAPAHKPRPAGLIEGVKAFVGAINDGLEAQHEYKLLTAHGVPTAEAAKAAFRDHPKKD